MEVKCSQCGGAVPVREREGVATCKFCGASLYVDLLEGVGHFLIKPVLNEKALAPQLATWLARRERRGDLKISRASLVFWPFWEIHDQEDKTSTFIAAAHPITAIEDAGPSPGNMRPYSDAELESGWPQPPDGVLRDFLQRVGIAAKKTLLIHQPFWQVRYVYDQMEYEAWIEGVRGEVFADDLPPTFAKEKDRIYQKAIATLFLSYLVVGVAIPDGNWAAAGMIAASLPLFFVVDWMVKEKVS